MIIRIYVEQEFSIIETSSYSFTLKVNENRSLLLSYTSKETAWQKKYLTLDELLLDNEICDTWKWLARGMLGIPLDVKK